MYYTRVVFEEADWTHRGEYIGKRGLTPAIANEAIADPDRVVINPDPASKTGRSARILGYSITVDAVLAVIVTEEDGVVWGLNAWKANDRDQRTYRGQE